MSYEFTAEDHTYIRANWPKPRTRAPGASEKRAAILAHYGAKGVLPGTFYKELIAIGVSEPWKTVPKEPSELALQGAAINQLATTVEALTECLGEIEQKLSARLNLLGEAVSESDTEIVRLGNNFDRLVLEVRELREPKPDPITAMRARYGLQNDRQH